MKKAMEKLLVELGDRVNRAHSVRLLHGENETFYPVMLPDAVVFPRSTQEVSKILRLCHMEGCPVIPFGAGTALEGQHLAVNGGLSLDFSEMKSTLRIYPEDMDVVVQPGMTREELNTELRTTGLFFPVDPGANATLGGMAATRASGTTSVRYGTMRDNVRALEVVLADGRIIRTGSRAKKSSAGYDLTGMFVGSEGTLGVITELTLRLHGQPESIMAAICRFDDMKAAVETVITAIQYAIPVARIELVDEQMVRGFNLYAGTSFPQTPHLFVEFHGSPAAVEEQTKAFRNLVEEFGGADFKWANTPKERLGLWNMRHKAHYAARALRPGARSLSTDVCVPISRLFEAISQARADAKRLEITMAIVGHVGEGNFHCAVLVNPDDPAEMARVHEFTDKLALHAIELGGTVSGEHGIGLGKRQYMKREHGEALKVMRTLKAALDPGNILNPGKLFPPE